MLMDVILIFTWVYITFIWSGNLIKINSLCSEIIKWSVTVVSSIRYWYRPELWNINKLLKYYMFQSLFNDFWSLWTSFIISLTHFYQFLLINTIIIILIIIHLINSSFDYGIESKPTKLLRSIMWWPVH